ncbi:MAG: DUF4350 domain-containing protein, partial [Pseudomonadota bacterium]
RALFVTGHGERRALGAANHDYGEFSNRLKERGYEIADVNLQLDTIEQRPGDVLVIAGAQDLWHENEITALDEYIAKGGDVLWLLDELGASSDLVADMTGLVSLPGVIVDAASEALNLPKPDFAVVSNYDHNASLASMDGISLFPRAIAFSDAQLAAPWQAEVLLQSTARSWNETSDIAGRIAPDQPGELTGPLVFGWQLTHNAQQGTMTVLGDGDFLANAWLGNGVNLALGERLFDSLVTESPVLVTAAPPRDKHVSVSKAQGLWLGGALFAALPLLLSSIAFWIWRRQVY